MSQYGLIYRSEWTMQDDTNEVRVNIYKTSVLIGDSDIPQVIDMLPAMDDSPLKIFVDSGNKSKLKAIRPTEARIAVLTDNNVNISTFSDGPDNLWYVEILLNQTDYIFKGFLVQADISQAFQPDYQTLILTATDGLGLLKDVPLTDLDGEVPTGKAKICFYLAYALNKTGMRLPMYVVNNLRHGSGSRTVPVVNFSNASSTIFFPSGAEDMFYVGQEIEVTSGAVANLNSTFIVEVVNGGTNIEVSPAPAHETGATNVVFEDVSSRTHFYNTVYLDAKTFESEIGECEDCYSVLEKILGNDCFICQYLGSWWIFRTDEWDENQIRVTIFDGAGVYQTDEGATDYNKRIGATEDLYFVLADAIVERERPVAFSKLFYEYEYPKEVPCNIDLNEGAYITDLAVTSDDEDRGVYTKKKYELDCWTLYQNRPNVPSTTAESYVVREFNNLDYEVSRYGVIGIASSSVENQLVSEFIPVSKNDKFELSFDVRYEGQIETASGTIINNYAQVRLHADDGTFYTVRGGLSSTGTKPEWKECTSDFNTNQRYFQLDFDGTDDDTQWRNVTFQNGDCPPIPKDGKIQIVVCHQTKVTQFALLFQQFRFEYIPYINGSYRKYTGQHQKVTRSATGYLNKYDEQVYMSDSPKKLFKGAMFLLVDGEYVLTKMFYPENVYPGGPSDITPVHPYGELQIRSVYNQQVYANWILTGTIYPFGEDWPAMIHKYIISDTHPVSNNRYFTCTGYEQDWKMGFMKLNLVEVYDRIRMKTYSDPREFKYITNG